MPVFNKKYLAKKNNCKSPYNYFLKIVSGRIYCSLELVIVVAIETTIIASKKKRDAGSTRAVAFPGRCYFPSEKFR